MAISAEGRRVAYDRFWGGMLLLGAALPYRLDGRSYPWQLVARGGLGPIERAWLALGAVAGAVALVSGIAGRRGRARHFVNFALGVACLALPLVAPAIWAAFPEANPAALPLGQAGSVGGVMLVALLAMYAGSGMRIVRPAQVPGQALGALGALLLLVFAFLPMEGSDSSFVIARARFLPRIGERWGELLPFLLVGAASVLGVLNLLRTSAEVALAKLTRLLLVSGLLAWLMLPFLEGAQARSGDLALHLPRAWGALHLLAPLFLALDGATAYLAVSITRSNE